MKRTVLIAATLLTGCVTALPPSGFARVTPAEIAASPAQWDGRRVEVTGLMTWEFENFGLYQSYDAYCVGTEGTAIYVDWPEIRGVSRADNHRMVTVRGTFRNLVGAAQANGSILISTGAPGPGPLEQGSLVKRRSPPFAQCRSR